MKYMMKKWKLMALIAIAVCVGVWMFSHRKPDAENPGASPAGRSVSDQGLVDSVVESPERLEASVMESVGDLQAEAPSPESVDSPRPQLLSEIEKPLLSQAKPEPVSIETLHFWSDYESLRADAIRDPESAENRAGVVSLMEARQRRLGQVER